jgi:hypothetical protein
VTNKAKVINQKYRLRRHNCKAVQILASSIKPKELPSEGKGQRFESPRARQRSMAYAQKPSRAYPLSKHIANRDTGHRVGRRWAVAITGPTARLLFVEERSNIPPRRQRVIALRGLLGTHTPRSHYTTQRQLPWQKESRSHGSRPSINSSRGWIFPGSTSEPFAK